MRILRITLIAATFLIAFFTSILTLLMGISRVANDPPGVESGLWGAVFIAAVGLVGAIIVFFKPYVATVILAVTAGLTIAIIPPENGVPVALFLGSAVLALAAYFVGGRMSGAAGVPRRRAGT